MSKDKITINNYVPIVVEADVAVYFPDYLCKLYKMYYVGIMNYDDASCEEFMCSTNIISSSRFVQDNIFVFSSSCQ